MSAWLARTLIGLYPRAWRQRYEGEMLALVAESGLSASSAVDLLVGAARERTRLLITWSLARFGGPLAVAWLATAAIATVAMGVGLVLSAISHPATWATVLVRSRDYVMLASLVRLGATRFWTSAPTRLIRSPELVAWTICALAVSASAQWLHWAAVARGLPPVSVSLVWRQCFQLSTWYGPILWAYEPFRAAVAQAKVHWAETRVAR